MYYKISIYNKNVNSTSPRYHTRVVKLLINARYNTPHEPVEYIETRAECSNYQLFDFFRDVIAQRRRRSYSSDIIIYRRA